MGEYLNVIMRLTMKKIGLSIIIPVYNAENWITPTVEHIQRALHSAAFDAEIIIVDDGSSDASAERAHAIPATKKLPIRVYEQKNAGRYLARKVGVSHAAKDNILFVDSRVYVDEGSLEYLASELQKTSRQLWNGHVNIDKKGNIFARFWDAIVCIAWRKYFRHPHRTSYTLAEFDYYPKGTGFFYVPKELLVEAMSYFEKTTNDLKFSSDDTLLIRYLIKQLPINLSPEFSCLYHGRSNLKGFLKHAYNRGQFFIDGFLRPGTRFFFPLLLVLVASIAVVGAFVMWPLYVGALLVGGAVVFAFALLVGALILGVTAYDAISLAVLGIPFACIYLCGLWRGVFRRLKRQ